MNASTDWKLREDPTMEVKSAALLKIPDNDKHISQPFLSGYPLRLWLSNKTLDCKSAYPYIQAW